MLVPLIRYLIAGGTVLLLVSLPLGKSETASYLRRMAGACFALAFAPYVFLDLLHSLPTSGITATMQPITFTCGDVLKAIGFVVLISPFAYLALLAAQRSRAGHRGERHHAPHRPSIHGKRPVPNHAPPVEHFLFADDEGVDKHAEDEP